MGVERFIKSVKEVYGVVTHYSIKDEQNTYGDWRFVKSELRGGDIQIVIYRKATEINIVYNQLTGSKIDFYVKFNKKLDPNLALALNEYRKDFVFDYPKNENFVQTTLLFKSISDFERFVYQYLLKTID